MNDSKFRKKYENMPRIIRFIKELQMVIWAFSKSSMFQMEKDGQKRRIYELAMTNGSRIAKINRVPIKLTDQAYFMAEFRSKHPKILLQLLKIARNKHYGQRVYGTLRYKTLQKIYAQVDGEVLEISRNSEITIKSNAKPFFALSTKLSK